MQVRCSRAAGLPIAVRRSPEKPDIASADAAAAADYDDDADELWSSLIDFHTGSSLGGPFVSAPASLSSKEARQRSQQTDNANGVVCLPANSSDQREEKREDKEKKRP